MVLKILKILNEEQEFVSGEFIANKLGITRAGVWKYISKLKNMGYEIISVNNKGYLLKDNKNLYNQFEILKNLHTDFIGKNIIFFDSIDSTNIYAKNLAYEGTKEGTVIISNTQINGKGRLEKQWISEKDSGIYMSIILRPNIELINCNQITLITSIALCRVLKSLNLETYIKWPNDIILNNKKISGILIELSAEIEKVNYIIVGVGINVNNKSIDENIKDKATSIFLETKNMFSRVQIIQSFLFEFEKMYTQYIKNSNFNEFLDEYKELCINLGKEVKIFSKDKEDFGKIVGITEYGQLIFLNNKNEEIKIISGEVSIRNIDGSYI